jgi:hypothetical protein
VKEVPVKKPEPESTLKMIEAAEAESATALREGAELVAAGLLKVGAAFLYGEKASSLSAAARQSGEDVREGRGLVPSAAQGAIDEAILRAYPRSPREMEHPWGETFKVLVSVRDCGKV